ncbi:MAG: hypothetical protein QM831_19795 [Kofleriaceae bacterium]
MRAALVVLCACGRVDFDPYAVRGDGAVDAPGDAAMACTQFGPWGTPTNLAQLNTPQTDWGPQFSNDGLELVFASTRAGGDAIYSSTRASLTDEFPAPIAAPGATGGADDPSLTADRLTLLSGSGGIHVATRTSIGAAWTDRGTLAITTTGFSVDGGPQLLADGSLLVFTGTAMSDGRWHQYQATRAPTTDIFAPFDPATAVPMTTSQAGEAYGALRLDGLEIVYETESAPGALYSATRAALTDSFGAATLLDLGPAANQYGDPSFSPDGMMLIFGSDRPGGSGDYDLWLATRSCL